MKKLCNIFLILVLCVSLFGCHGKNQGRQTSFTVPSEFDDSENYEITFWAKNDNNKKQVDVYKQAISEFEELYPNISVVLKTYTDYTSIYNDVITNISTNTTPNVCITYPDHIATYLTGADTIVNLNDLIDNPKYGLGGTALKFDGPRKDEIIPEFFNECIVNDDYYALPYMRSTEALYVNKDFVEKLGYELPEVITWNYIWEVSDAATAKDSNGNYIVNNQKTMIPFIYKSTDNMMISMLKQSNKQYSSENGEVYIFNDDTTEILEEISKHVDNGAFSTFKISSYPGNYLNAGQCVFAIDSTAGASWMGGDAPLIDIHKENCIDFNIEVMPIPQYDVNNRQMISQGPSICVFNKSSDQEVLASWLFAQYLLSNSIQCAYAKTEGYIPVTSKALNSYEFLDYMNKIGIDNDEHYEVKIKASKLLINNIENTFVTPVFNGSASLRIAAGQLIEETCKGVKRNKTIDDDFFKELYANIKSLYRLDQISSINMHKDFGPLPNESKVLLGSLLVAWFAIACYFVRDRIRKH